MNKLYGALTGALILLLLCAGCSDLFKAKAGFSEEDGDGSGGPTGTESVLVPGGGDLTADKLIRTYNGRWPGKPGMRAFALSKIDIDWSTVTGPETLADGKKGPDTFGLWPKDNKFHIMGMPTGGYMNAGFDDDVFVYYDKPFAKDETFRFSARVRILTVGGVSTGKGIHVGAYSPSYYPYEDADGKSPGTGKAPVSDETGTWQVFDTGGASGSKGVGLFLRAEATPQFRLYYSSFPDGSTTAGNTQPYLVTSNVTSGGNRLTDLKVGKEYIYEITRAILPVIYDHGPAQDKDENDFGKNTATQRIERKMAYGFRLLDSKTYEPVSFHPHPAIGSLVPPTRVDGTSNFNADGTLLANTNHTTTGTGTAAVPNGGVLGSGYLVTLPVDSTFHPFGTPVRIHPALREQDVFAGICVPGSNVEISQIKVWHDGDAKWNYRDHTQDRDDPNGDPTIWIGDGDKPDFETPNTIPAYVPASTIFSVYFIGNSTFTRLVGEDVSINYTAAQLWNLNLAPAQAASDQTFGIAKGAYQVPMLPTITPNFADDKIRFQIKELEPHPKIIMDGVLPYTVQDVDDIAYEYFIMTIDEAKMASGETVTGRYKIVAIDLNLEVVGEDGKGAPDYSQKQSLPEYYFKVTARKP